MQSGHQPRTLGLTNRRRPSSSDHGLQALLAAHQPEQISNLPKVALSLRRSPYQGGAACPQDALSFPRWRGLSPRRSLLRGYGRQRIRDNACHLGHSDVPDLPSTVYCLLSTSPVTPPKRLARFSDGRPLLAAAAAARPTCRRPKPLRRRCGNAAWPRRAKRRPRAAR
jgi:hypothetical protein